MKHKVLYIALAVLALTVAIPLATNVLAQTPTPTPSPTPTAVPSQPPAAGPLMRLGILKDFQTIKRVATLLKLTPQDLYTRVQSGQTLAQIAQAQGVSLDDLAATILAPFKDQLQLRVKYGYITQEQADYTLFVRTQQLKDQLNRPLPTGRMGTKGRRDPRGMMGPQGLNGQGSGSGGMMPQGMGSGGMGSGMMGPGMTGGGMMGGGSGQTW